MAVDWFTLEVAAKKIGLKRQSLDKYRKQLAGSQYQKKAIHKGKEVTIFSSIFVREVKRLRQQSNMPFVISKPTKEEQEVNAGSNVLEAGLHFQDDGTMVMVYSPDEYNQLVYQLKDYKRLSEEYQEVKKKLDQATDKLYKALDNANAIQQQLNYIKAKELGSDDEN